jgi:hypothetical protein
MCFLVVRLGYNYWGGMENFPQPEMSMCYAKDIWAQSPHKGAQNIQCLNEPPFT